LLSLTDLYPSFPTRRSSDLNRCYYATFHAAIAALISSAIRPSGSQWGHDFVQAQFNGQLINRRKVFPTALRNTLEQNYRFARGRSEEHTSELQSQSNLVCRL